MKHITEYLSAEYIRHIEKVEDIDIAFDKNGIAFHRLPYINWKNYPYRPEAKFRIAHDGNNIYINWFIKEKEVKAACDKDMGEVWKDSCVEFFITFDNLNYYNIEANCIGKVYAAIGPSRNNREPLRDAFLAKIRRYSTLGNSPIHINRKMSWKLSLIIPKDIFFKDHLKSLNNVLAQINLYKCGDDLQEAHFISWKPIKSDTPDFHLPSFFKEIRFVSGNDK